MLNEKGQEIPDDTPVVIRFKSRVITEFDRVREFIQRELSDTAARTGAETFAEANDFDVDDDLFPVSPHEYAEDTEAADREVLNAGDPRKKATKKPKPSEGKPSDGAGSEGGSPSPGLDTKA